jgi:hypothetical protein
MRRNPTPPDGVAASRRSTPSTSRRCVARSSRSRRRNASRPRAVASRSTSPATFGRGFSLIDAEPAPPRSRAASEASGCLPMQSASAAQPSWRPATQSWAMRLGSDWIWTPGRHPHHGPKHPTGAECAGPAESRLYEMAERGAALRSAAPLDRIGRPAERGACGVAPQAACGEGVRGPAVGQAFASSCEA